jgi:peptidoglycan/xylan/chitin deacetylase (PgdA/CDA1 family)
MLSVENQAVSAPSLPASRSFDSRLPIVSYHNVGLTRPDVNPLLTVTPEQFAKQVHWLARTGYSSINTSDWFAWVTEKRPIPKRPVLITFDDGYEDITRHALPLLSHYGFKAVVYIVTGLIGRVNEWDIGKVNEWDLRAWPGELQLMSEEQIIEWATKGCEFGSHTRHHPDLRTLCQNELEDEVFGSAADLRRILGVVPTSFAYPYGHFNQTVRDCVSQVYRTSVTVVEAICTDRDDPNLMPRILARPGENLSSFAHRVKYGSAEPTWKLALRRVPGIRNLRRLLTIWRSLRTSVS